MGRRCLSRDATKRGGALVTGAEWLADANRDSPWSRLTVTVAGIGVSGFAAADALLQLGARVYVLDSAAGDRQRERAQVLAALGADVRLAAPEELPDDTELVVTSPGWRPDSPLLTQAAKAGVPVWSEVELAWRLRPASGAAPWLTLTGTNGKTTTVRMLAAMLQADGLRAVAAGNVGTPLVDVVMAEPRYDVVAVELSSFQLHWSESVRAHAAAVLNIAPDHVDWHGDLDAYVAAKGRIYRGAQAACVYNAQDPRTELLARAADVAPGCRVVGFTLDVPTPGQLGVADGRLVDRAFAGPPGPGVDLAAKSDVHPAAVHNVANALAAAALSRSFGVSPHAVREGLRAYRPEPHRITEVATVHGVTYVDDSKATNPHAAAASLAAFGSIVWIAGGLAKGATFDELVAGAATRLRGVVLLGADRAAIRAAITRHAPDVPVVEVDRTDTEAMDRVVQEAARLAEPGDTVLLAPACASMDMFASYVERGDRFAAAVHRLAERQPGLI
jgi:UDP-N-acetylmuramoylalanine--D-glutamate ligase